MHDKAGSLEGLVVELKVRLAAVTAVIDDPLAKAALIAKASALVQNIVALDRAFERLAAARSAEASDGSG